MTLIHETIISAYTHTYTYIDNNQNKCGIGIFKCLIVFSLWHIYICICFVLVFCEYFGVIQELKSSWTRCSSHSVPWMYPRAAHAQNGSRKPPLLRACACVCLRAGGVVSGCCPSQSLLLQWPSPISSITSPSTGSDQRAECSVCDSPGNRTLSLNYKLEACTLTVRAANNYEATSIWTKALVRMFTESLRLTGSPPKLRLPANPSYKLLAAVRLALTGCRLTYTPCPLLLAC